MNLLFNSEEHRYYFEEEPDIKLTSVSTLIGMYHEKFDSDKHSKRIAEREGVSQEEILERWKKTNQDSLITDRDWETEVSLMSGSSSK